MNYGPARATCARARRVLFTVRVLIALLATAADAPKYYGFSEWAIQLNEITPDIKEYLPPTDSRLRPDQRALEEGDVDAAEHGKQTLEQKQRERRKKWEGAPKDAKPPQFFAPGEGTGQWHYKGDYCKWLGKGVPSCTHSVRLRLE